MWSGWWFFFAESGRFQHAINTTVASEPFDVVGIRMLPDLPKKLHCSGFVARFAGVFVGDNHFNLDRHYVHGGLNQSSPFDSFTLHCLPLHYTPLLQSLGCMQANQIPVIGHLIPNGTKPTTPCHLVSR